MTDRGARGFRETLDQLHTALDAPNAVARRDELKSEIIALFKAVDREISHLSALKEDVKGLVSKWKALDGGDADEDASTSLAGVAPAAADAAPASTAHAESPPAPAAPAIPTRSDHLNASSHVEKGWSLISLGDFAAAEESLTKALVLVPNDTHAQALLGWAQMHQEKYDDALLHFQQVLRREPANALARVNVGYICLKKRIFGEAIEHLSRTIRLDNDRKATLYAHYYLGLLYLEREMFDDAEVFLSKAIALGPNLVEAYFELGRARWFAGRVDGAAQAWRDGSAANKFSPWRKRCAEMLEYVESGGVPTR